MLPPEEKWIKPGTSVWFDEKHLQLGMVIESFVTREQRIGGTVEVLKYWIYFVSQDRRYPFVHERVVNAAKKMEKIRKTRQQNESKSR